jgi:hypothetical protein
MCSKQSLLVDLKPLELYVDLDFDSEIDKGKLIIGVEPNVTIATIKVQLEEP